MRRQLCIEQFPVVANADTPPTPVTGYYSLFVREDGGLYRIDDAGVETLLSLGQEVQVDVSFVFAGTVTGDANQPNLVATITPTRTDAPFTFTAATNSITYAAVNAANRIEVFVHEYYEDPTAAARSRINPTLELLRGTTVVGKSATGYQRHAADGNNTSSNGISWTDVSPDGQTYSLRAQQGSAGETEVVNRDIASISIIATERVTVIR